MLTRRSFLHFIPAALALPFVARGERVEADDGWEYPRLLANMSAHAGEAAESIGAFGAGTDALVGGMVTLSDGSSRQSASNTATTIRLVRSSWVAIGLYGDPEPYDFGDGWPTLWRIDSGENGPHRHLFHNAEGIIVADRVGDEWKMSRFPPGGLGVPL